MLYERLVLFCCPTHFSPALLASVLMNKILTIITVISLFSCSNYRKSPMTEDLTKPEISEEFRDYLTEAHDYLTTQQDICRDTFGLNSYERWFYDQHTGLLEFFNGDTIKLRIKYQEVGSVSKISNTWLWAWDNPNLVDGIATESFRVKEFGELEKYERLTKSKWIADEVDGWEMTSIMAYLLNAKGAYRISGENVFSYVIFMDIDEMNEIASK